MAAVRRLVADGSPQRLDRNATAVLTGMIAGAGVSAFCLKAAAYLSPGLVVSLLTAAVLLAMRDRGARPSPIGPSASA